MVEYVIYGHRVDREKLGFFLNKKFIRIKSSIKIVSDKIINF